MEYTLNLMTLYVPEGIFLLVIGLGRRMLLIDGGQEGLHSAEWYGFGQYDRLTKMHLNLAKRIAVNDFPVLKIVEKRF